MPVPMPDFFKDRADDALNEFRTFHAAHPADAASRLAYLTSIRSVGLNVIPASHGIVTYNRFRCIQTSGWAIFYVATGVLWKRAVDPMPDVWVMLVEEMSGRPFSAISGDAVGRVNRAGL